MSKTRRVPWGLLGCKEGSEGWLFGLKGPPVWRPLGGPGALKNINFLIVKRALAKKEGAKEPIQKRHRFWNEKNVTRRVFARRLMRKAPSGGPEAILLESGSVLQHPN